MMSVLFLLLPFINPLQGFDITVITNLFLSITSSPAYAKQTIWKWRNANRLGMSEGCVIDIHREIMNAGRMMDPFRSDRPCSVLMIIIETEEESR
ncbi:hypothetical protein AVEN_86821-1 [Araneus ventricosus]|uniref:Secreted protein n=1 Tax=Araneus ventricosus TaxID=182803 RepID=A0A4Y2D0P4_ARAVE|nr:hypothetical protein AVEN_86821-1 [Araneus ventricosus]